MALKRKAFAGLDHHGLDREPVACTDALRIPPGFVGAGMVVNLVPAFGLQLFHDVLDVLSMVLVRHENAVAGGDDHHVFETDDRNQTLL